MAILATMQRHSGLPGAPNAQRHVQTQVNKKADPLSVSDEVSNITNSNSLAMRSARSRGNQIAANRGLINTTLGAEASQRAMVDAALPMAQQNVQQRYNANENRLGREHDTTMQGQRQAWQTGENRLNREQAAALQKERENWQTGESRLGRAHDTTMQGQRQAWQTGENRLGREHESAMLGRRIAGQQYENAQNRALQEELQNSRLDWQENENRRNRDQQTEQNRLGREQTAALQEGRQNWQTMENLSNRAQQTSENRLSREQASLLQRMRQGWQTDENRLNREQTAALQESRQNWQARENLYNRGLQERLQDSRQEWQSGENTADRQNRERMQTNAVRANTIGEYLDTIKTMQSDFFKAYKDVQSSDMPVDAKKDAIADLMNKFGGYDEVERDEKGNVIKDEDGNPVYKTKNGKRIHHNGMLDIIQNLYGGLKTTQEDWGGFPDLWGPKQGDN